MYKDSEVSKSDNIFTRVYKQRVRKAFGKITNYGENFWFPENFTKNSETCEWLPGCCMTYNFNLLGDLKFNLSLENGPGKSYAVGEDVDFSLRASDCGPLYVMGSIVVDHREESGTRDNRILMAKARGTFRAYLTYQKRISLMPVLFHMNLNTLGSLFRLILGKPNSIRILKEDVACLIFYIRELFVKNLRPERSLSK
jgi:GT2 family glycosyltransferase